jgi:hypothetical protein
MGLSSILRLLNPPEKKLKENKTEKKKKPPKIDDLHAKNKNKKDSQLTEEIKEDSLITDLNLSCFNYNVNKLITLN